MDGPGAGTAWSLRQATAGDREFLWELHRRTMREYVEAVWGWDEAFQVRHFDERFLSGSCQIIQAHGSDVGMVNVWKRPNDVMLVNIRVLPEWQGRGIGTGVVRWVLAETDEPVVLQVLKVNVRATQLYLREGFSVESETETHLRMRADPRRD